jgi:type II secretory ATPase GspE/PulE/Tfp pilus assembly ATPase PilB-like protein
MMRPVDPTCPSRPSSLLARFHLPGDLRPIALAALALVVMLGPAAGELLAQDGGWSVSPLPDGWSGPGFYLDWLKILLAWLVFLFWVGTTDWVSRDAQAHEMDYLRWNPIVVGVFLVAQVLLWLLPLFWVSFAILVLAWIVPLGTYIIVRNQKVDESERVLTPSHLRYCAATLLNKFGANIEVEKRDPLLAAVPVVLTPAAGNERDNAARTLAARQTPGLPHAQRLIYNALCRRADAVMLDYSQQGVAMRLLIDGIWQNGEPLDREIGDPALESLKVLAGLNPKDRQNRQEGKLAAEYTVFRRSVFDQVEKAKEAYRKKLAPQLTKEFAAPGVSPAELQMKIKIASDERTRSRFSSPIGPWTPVELKDLSQLRGAEKVDPNRALDKMACGITLMSQGTPTGERAVLQLEIKKTRFANLDEIGMRTKMQEELREVMGKPGGMILFSAIPGGGLRSTVNVVLRAVDRFTREFVSVEDENNRYEPVENLPVFTYKSSEGQTPATVLPNVFHTEPQVVVVRDLVNAETVEMLLAEASHPRLILSTVRAKDCIDAIYRVLALGVPAADLAPALNAVLCQRLIRKLCENCKEAYAPTAQVLAQLGIPAGRVQALYRPPQQRSEVCPECNGVGYLGRTGIFELLVMNDTLRQTLAANPNPDVFRQAAQKAGLRSIQDEGIVLVAKGVTSLQELMRVLKQ